MDSVFSVWLLIGVAFIFFMQAGFAMVETGFTRAKNAGNIIMKNLMDFCIGTVVFSLLGFGIMLGEDAFFGLIGKPTLQLFSNYESFDWSSFVFNLVFCATTATIVSGAMAERTKFISYCVYSAVLSAVIYPVEAHWIWGGGWLSKLGFIDFAGSCAIHMVGGISALIGAAILGARIGKFKRDPATGKVKKVRVIPAHSLTLGALGCFILWFGWYGFNGAAATSTAQLGSVFLTTTVSPAVATVVCMIFTWIKYGKPDVSMCLNASLAGLVGITAGCAVTDVFGAFCIGTVSGLLVVFGVWLLDHVLHIDDPVGAVAVHCLNGIWGTFAVGLFATSSAPENDVNGLFYGGGFKQLGTQLLGIVSVALWTAVTVTILFLVIKRTIGLRVSEEEEIIGLDATEHNLPSCYADFMPAPTAPLSIEMAKKAKEVGVKVYDYTATTVSAPTSAPEKVNDTHKLTKLAIVCRQSKLEALQAEFNAIGVTGLTVAQVLGYGSQKGHTTYYRGTRNDDTRLLPKIKVEVVVSKVSPQEVIEAAKRALYTGNYGDGKIFVYDVEDVVKIRTGERGYDAIQLDEDE